MPLLAAEMDPTLQIFNISPEYHETKRRCEERLVQDVKLAPLFRNLIKTLELGEEAKFLPHPGTLKSLTKITSYVDYYCSVPPSAADDEAIVLRACRWALGIRPGAAHSLSWLFKLGRITRSLDTPSGVQVIARHRVCLSHPSGAMEEWRSVHYDIVGKAIVKQVGCNDAEWADGFSGIEFAARGFWKRPPTTSIGEEKHIRPTSV